ncbi:hypothetical protein HYW75_05595 [Candidatus Pacearchaeota archaeon]|nr:hypothetical protein [Candidatus Pacearchaeota archaeon]
MKNRKYNELAEKLEGVYTVETLCERLKIKRRRAIYIVHKLRKIGYVRTTYGAGRDRIYYISRRNKQKGISYTEIINEVSPIQLASSNPYYIHGRIPSYEEALIYALKQKDIRYTIASLILFRKIKDWNLLYRTAKKEGLVRKIAALYYVARKVVRKVRRIPKRFLHLAQKEKKGAFEYIVEPYTSNDYKTIERKWRVHIPINLSDLEDYSQ